MGIFDNRVNLALVAIVGFAIIGMVLVVPIYAADGQNDITPVQFPSTPEEEAPEEGAPGEEPAPDASTLGETTEEEHGATTPEPFGAPAPKEESAIEPEEGGMTPEDEIEGLEAYENGEFSSSVKVSPTPDTEATITIEGSGLTIEDMNFDQTGNGGTLILLVGGVFSIGAANATATTPEPEPFGAPEAPEGGMRPAPGEEPSPGGGLNETSPTPEEPTLGEDIEDADTAEPSELDQTAEEGFLNSVSFSPKAGAEVTITIEGTGLEIQNMSVTQGMEGQDRFHVSIEVLLSSGAMGAGMTTATPQTSSASISVNPSHPRLVTL